MAKQLTRWLRTASVEERRLLAAGAGSTLNYLRQIARGERQCSADLAISVEHTATDLRAENNRLPPLYREHLASACGRCEFARQCR